MVRSTTVLCDEGGWLPADEEGRRGRPATHTRTVKGADDMTSPLEDRPRPLPFRLTTGLGLLEEWSATATQVQKNVVNQLLFAIAGRTVFTEYIVVDDVTKTMEFFVLAKCHLAVKIRVHGLDSFGIVYIGPADAAPGLDRAVPDSGVFAT
jgi:Family of unknown function (DUF6235)